MSGAPHEPEQHCPAETQTSSYGRHPHIGSQKELPRLFDTQRVSQHDRSPVQGSFVGTHCVRRSHRCVVGSQPPSQQSLFFSQMSPPARQ